MSWAGLLWTKWVWKHAIASGGAADFLPPFWRGRMLPAQIGGGILCGRF